MCLEIQLLVSGRIMGGGILVSAIKLKAAASLCQVEVVFVNTVTLNSLQACKLDITQNFVQG